MVYSATILEVLLARELSSVGIPYNKTLPSQPFLMLLLFCRTQLGWFELPILLYLALKTEKMITFVTTYLTKRLMKNISN